MPAIVRLLARIAILLDSLIRPVLVLSLPELQGCSLFLKPIARTIRLVFQFALFDVRELQPIQFLVALPFDFRVRNRHRFVKRNGSALFKFFLGRYGAGAARIVIVQRQETDVVCDVALVHSFFGLRELFDLLFYGLLLVGYGNLLELFQEEFLLLFDSREFAV